MTAAEWIAGIGGALFVVGMSVIYLMEYRKDKQRQKRTHKEWKVK